MSGRTRIREQNAAIAEIRRIAAENFLAVSIVTPEDVTNLRGVEEPTPEQLTVIVNSYEWAHYGESWYEQFESLDPIPEKEA
jgi:hypothetical protein